MKQQVKISKVKGNPSNPRIIKNDKFKKLVKSIKEFPEMLKLRPIVVDEDFMVLGGNMRLKASKEAGLKEVWIDIAEGLTEEQKKEFIVKDNVGFGEWEWDILANEWDSVQLAEWGLDVWENEDDKIAEAGLIEDDEIPEVKESIVKRGDIWQLGEHRVMCGDSTSSDDVEKLMNGEKADMVFTDPPYGVDYIGGSKKRDGLKGDEKETTIYEDVIPLIASVCIGPCYVWYADKNPNGLYSSVKQYGDIHSVIIWNKNNSTFNMNIHYKAKHEPCLYWKPKKSTLRWGGNNKEETVWSIDRESSNKLHPTQKPIELATRAISNHECNNVLDLFLGSGSTLIAAEKLKRKCYGMELDEKYCDVIINRWEQFTGLKATIINGTK